MSEEVNGTDGAPGSTADGQNQESQSQAGDAGGEQSVKFGTFDKVMKKFKATEAERDQLKERITRIEQEKLEAEGNKDQLIASLRKENTELKTKHTSAVGSFALSQGKLALADEAVKVGCNSPELLSKVLENDIQGLDFGSDFRPDPDQVKALVEKARKENPVLFSKKAPTTANHNSVVTDPDAQARPTRKPIAQMSDEELDKMWDAAHAGKLN